MCPLAAELFVFNENSTASRATTALVPFGLRSVVRLPSSSPCGCGAESPRAEFATHELQAAREVVHAVVAPNGCALELTSQELQADQVVLTAVAQNGPCSELASQELQADGEIVA